ncbi:MAG: DUF839 domain-containing protein [Magnetococcus sp. WYHC-3]
MRQQSPHRHNLTDPAAPAAEPTRRPEAVSFHTLVQRRLSRRDMLAGAMATGAMAFMAGVSMATPKPAAPHGLAREPGLGFAPVVKTLDDRVSLPPGYRYDVLCALGDPLAPGVTPWGDQGREDDDTRRFGDHHDGMEYFGLSPQGLPDPANSQRALIGLNHEATTTDNGVGFFLHPQGGTATRPRPAAEMAREMAAHGVSVFEIRRENGHYRCVSDSPFNFRVHPDTPVDLHGPARGHPLMVTRHAPHGQSARGTLANCGTGRTPWGTLLSGEENWARYFFRQAEDDQARGFDRSVVALNRYDSRAGRASLMGWEGNRADADRPQSQQRWDISRQGASADGSDDYRNEINTFGYIVEIDPYDATRHPRKRTALGRMAHEAACFSRAEAGRPLAVYMGDDAPQEYIYKWVSARPWHPDDARRSDRLAVGDAYLDRGTLHVARLAEDGSGRWIPLTLEHADIGASGHFPFVDLADICVHARLAADAVQATPMDRPEWSGVDPASGEVYFSLTNNTLRRGGVPGDPLGTDAANPRSYCDLKGVDTVIRGNVNGHILRICEDNDDPAARTFRWDVYVFGAEAGAVAAINLSQLGPEQDFSCPDGLVFTPSTGICWILTNDNYYTDVTNSMLLAALPGRLGDGGQVRIPGTLQTTWRGAPPGPQRLRRFLVGPRDCEITGLCESPDGRALFVNIQHAGEGTAAADLSHPERYTSHWPGNAGYGAGGDMARPRSATIVITREDGGVIGRS